MTLGQLYKIVKKKEKEKEKKKQNKKKSDYAN